MIKKNTLIKYKFILIFILITFSILSCKTCVKEKKENYNKYDDLDHHNGDHHHTEMEEFKFTVTTSDDFVRNLTEVLGGRRNIVNSILKPGEITYLKILTKNEKEIIKKSDLYLYNGLEISKDTKKFLKKNKRKIKSFDITTGIDPKKYIESDRYKSGYDPHIWFDAETWVLVYWNVTKNLIELDPEMEFKYKSNYRRYGETISMMDRYIKGWISKIPPENRNLITVNKSFDYIVKNYDFKTYCLNDLMINDEIDYKKLGELADVIIEKKIPVIFTEMYFDDTVVNELNRILLEKNYKINISGDLYTYSLGDLGNKEYHYINAFRKNIDIIYNALK